QPVQNLSVGSTVSKSQYQYTLLGPDTQALYTAAPAMLDKIAQLDFLRDVTSDLQITNPQLSIDVDRDKLAALGISEDQVRGARNGQSATRQVATLYTASNQYQVIIENDPQYQRDAADLSQTYVRTSGGRLVPIESIAKIRQSIGPLQVNHAQQ